MKFRLKLEMTFRKTLNLIRKFDRMSNTALWQEWESRKLKRTYKMVKVSFPNNPDTYDKDRGEGTFRIVLRKVK